MKRGGKDIESDKQAKKRKQWSPSEKQAIVKLYIEESKKDIGSKWTNTRGWSLKVKEKYDVTDASIIRRWRKEFNEDKEDNMKPWVLSIKKNGNNTSCIDSTLADSITSNQMHNTSSIISTVAEFTSSDQMLREEIKRMKSEISKYKEEAIECENKKSDQRLKEKDIDEKEERLTQMHDDLKYREDELVEKQGIFDLKKKELVKREERFTFEKESKYKEEAIVCENKKSDQSLKDEREERLTQMLDDLKCKEDELVEKQGIFDLKEKELVEREERFTFEKEKMSDKSKYKQPFVPFKLYRVAMTTEKNKTIYGTVMEYPIDTDYWKIKIDKSTYFEDWNEDELIDGIINYRAHEAPFLAIDKKLEDFPGYRKGSYNITQEMSEANRQSDLSLLFYEKEFTFKSSMINKSKPVYILSLEKIRLMMNPTNYFPHTIICSILTLLLHEHKTINKQQDIQVLDYVFSSFDAGITLNTENDTPFLEYS